MSLWKVALCDGQITFRPWPRAALPTVGGVSAPDRLSVLEQEEDLDAWWGAQVPSLTQYE